MCKKIEINKLLLTKNTKRLAVIIVHVTNKCEKYEKLSCKKRSKMCEKIEINKKHKNN